MNQFHTEVNCKRRSSLDRRSSSRDRQSKRANGPGFFSIHGESALQDGRLQWKRCAAARVVPLRRRKGMEEIYLDVVFLGCSVGYFWGFRGKFWVVMNTFSNGEWGKEERKAIPYKKGEKFDLRIRAHDDRFQ
ncbi:unnamed protein product, partial [Anisakis simplex]|uniref:Galectin n=1 Tax=Anisakis simplex TaxID=6269 RepID=A0A0M3JFX4_ANISI